MSMNEQAKGTVLVVDDKPTNLGVLFEYLSDEGFEVLIAQDGKSAIRQAEIENPDIIILDVMMPGINGFETCDILKKAKKTKEIPIIFMTALADTTDKLRGFRVGGVDYITKPFQQEEVLARLNTHLTICRQREKLEELNVSKNKFFSILAHDLKGPFSSLLEGNKLLAEFAEKYDTESVKKFARSSYEASEKVFRLLENLLTWARLQIGTIDYSPTYFDVSLAIYEIIDLYRYTNGKEKNIEVINSVPEKTVVFGDIEMVGGILRNLISNAIKFSKEGEKIDISAKDNGEFVEVAVKDNGIGIEEEDMEKLFRIDINHSTRGTSNECGTGLGLILCKDFVERNGGKIWVESEPEKGSTFRFTLPKKPIK